MVIDHLDASELEIARGNLKSSVTSYRQRFFAWVIDAFVFFPFSALIAFPWLKALRSLKVSDRATPDEVLLVFFYITTFVFAISAFKSLYRVFSQRTPGEKAMGLHLRFRSTSTVTHIFWSGFWREFLCWVSIGVAGFPWIYEIAKHKSQFFYDRLTETHMSGTPESQFDKSLVSFFTPLSHVMILFFSVGLGFVMARVAVHARNGDFGLVSKIEKEALSCKYTQSESVEGYVDVELVKYLQTGKNVDCLATVKDILLKSLMDENRELGLSIGLILSMDDDDLSAAYKREICSTSNLELCTWATHQDLSNPKLEDWIALPGLDLTSDLLRLKALKAEKEVYAEEMLAIYKHLSDTKELKKVMQRDYLAFLLSRIKTDQGRKPASVGKNPELDFEADSKVDDKLTLDILKREIDSL